MHRLTVPGLAIALADNARQRPQPPVSGPIRALPPLRNKRFRNYATTTPQPNDGVPNPALLNHLSTYQRTIFLKEWNRLKTHVREIAFDLNGPCWTPAVITQLSGILADFPDVLSKSSTDFGSSSRLRFQFRRTTLRLHHTRIPHSSPDSHELVAVLDF